MAIDSRNTWVYSPLDLTTTAVSITGATLVSTTIAAAGASVRNIVKRLTITCGASGAQAPLFVGVYDGASTSSAVLALYAVMPTLTAASTGAQSISIDLDNLHIKGSANTITTVGTTAAPAASTSVGVTVQSYIFPKANAVTVTNPS
jgi:hypothetical protein